MAHSSVLAWRIPGTGEPGGLPSVASHRVGHDWSDLAAAAAARMMISTCLVILVMLSLTSWLRLLVYAQLLWNMEYAFHTGSNQWFQTGSRSGKEYIKAVYCHPAYLTYIQSTSCEMPGWMKDKPGVLQSMGLQRVGHDWATKLNWSAQLLFFPL